MAAVNRRVFGGKIGGTFLTGLLGGLGVGASGASVAFLARRPVGWESAHTSYAQQGEDLIVDSLLEFLGIARPTYLDVGACEPVRESNTYFFYERGCRGVLVEPNPARRKALTSVRAGDTVLSVGVGKSKGTMDFHVTGTRRGTPLDTFDQRQVDEYVRQLGPEAIDHVIQVPVVPINEVIGERFKDGPSPDFLSVDTEGMDLEILGSMDFDRFRPAVVCAETLIWGTKRVETRIVDLMVGKGYVVRGGTHVNTIFADGRRLEGASVG